MEMLVSSSVAGPGSESVLIVEVPEAEAAVGRHRERLDANASLGIPAHFTVLSPFMPPEDVGPLVLGELERLFAGFRGFRFQLTSTSWFGDETLWLAPRDPAPFRALTASVYAAFPAFPPFGGRHEVLIPHLTVGHGHPVVDMLCPGMNTAGPAAGRAGGEGARRALPSSVIMRMAGLAGLAGVPRRSTRCSRRP
jgi:2'-5' RNA ligase superfamily